MGCLTAQDNPIFTPLVVDGQTRRQQGLLTTRPGFYAKPESIDKGGGTLTSTNEQIIL
jgi:hypothetical protein